MRVAVIGRASTLLESARMLVQHGHTVPVVWTCRAEPDYDTREHDFADFAKEQGADFVNDAGINRPESLERLRQYDCRIAISSNWQTLVSQSAIDIFPLGILNAHTGDLPRYRGNACPNWAILNGEDYVGNCVIQMTPDLDAGPVVLRERFPLTSDTYIGDVHAWLRARTPVMFVEAVEGLAAGRLNPQPQPADPAEVLRTYPRRPDDGRIDWAWPAQRILRLIRATSRPYPGAFTTLEGGTRVTIWRARQVVPAGQFLAVPGQICWREGNDPVIACGDSMICLTEIEMEGVDGVEQAKALVHRSLRNRLS